MQDIGPRISSLASAEAALARAGAALKEAEARLAEAAKAQPQPDADPATANDSIEVCRETCRRARQEWRLALYRHDRHSYALGGLGCALPAVDTGIRITGQGPLPIRAPGVSRPARDDASRSIRSGSYALHHATGREAGESGRGKETYAGSAVPVRRFPDPEIRRGRLLLARHAATLLALVLAYLQYHFIDVQLVIETLPVVTVYLPPW